MAAMVVVEPAAGGTDPMRPTPANEAAAAPAATGAAQRSSPGVDESATWRVVSIRTEANGLRIALLGAQWVRPGDAIGGWRIVGIDADAVRLMRDGERRTLRLWGLATPLPSTSRTASP